MKSEIFSSWFILFIILFIGVVLHRIQILRESSKFDLSRLVIDITLPALIFSSLVKDVSSEEVYKGIPLIIFGIVVPLISFLISFLFAFILNLKGSTRNIFLILSSIGNNALLPLPLCYALYGKMGVIYVILYNLGTGFIIWTLGIYLLTTHFSTVLFFKNLIKPGLIALVSGFLISIHPEIANKIPAIFLNSLEILGQATIPLALLLVGGILAEVKLSLKIISFNLLLISLIKLILTPLFTAFLILFTISSNNLVSKITFIQSAMPSMAITVVFARRYNSDTQLAASGVFLTHILSFFTVPFIIQTFT